MHKAMVWPLVLLLFAACGSQENNPAPPQACSVPSRAVASTQEQSLSAAGNQKGTRFIAKLSSRRSGAQSVVLRNGGAWKGMKARMISRDQLAVHSDTEITVAEAAARLGAEELEYIEPDFIVSTAQISNDKEVAKQWAHNTVKSAQAWAINRGSRDVIVAVLDSGVDYNHEDLAANMWRNPDESANGTDSDGNGYIDDIYGWNFVDNNNRPLADDKSSHGTHVAGTIGAVGNNNIGISGHAQRVRLMALKFLGSGGTGYTSDAIRGIDYAIDKGAHIINNSWGSSNRSQALSDAIDRARAAGILFVVAAGNNGTNNDRFHYYPTNFPQDNIVRVAASNSSDKMASFSNFGPARVDLAAPGQTIYSTVNGNRYLNLSGTSMATPLVSGVLATMIAARPDLGYWQHKSILLKSVDVLPAYTGKVATNGRVNAFRALAAVSSADLEPPPQEDRPDTEVCP